MRHRVNTPGGREQRQACDTLRRALGHGQGHHSAIARPDNREACEPRRVGQGQHGLGLIVDGREGGNVLGEKIDREELEAARIQGMALACHARPPASLSVLRDEATRCGDTAEHGDGRRTRRPGQPPGRLDELPAGQFQADDMLATGRTAVFVRAAGSGGC